jgi:hypothetical protein
MRRNRDGQREIVFRTHGGKRRGAGRKPSADRAQVTHAKRPALSGREPVLVTLKVRRDISRLRSRRILQRLLPALVAAREGLMRLVHFSVQHDHVHLIVEAKNERELARGAQGLSVRLARALNGAMRRTGKVFKDRYHARVLATPRQVRNALAYVLCNARKHRVPLPSRGLDPCSSAAAFDAWSGRVIVSMHALSRALARVAVAPTTWLLRVGWRRAGGPLDPEHCPGPYGASDGPPAGGAQRRGERRR